MDSNNEVADSLRMTGAAEQARAISQGKLDAVSLAISETAATDSLNPQLNAFVQRAHRSNGSCDVTQSSLSGTSFAVKDNIDVSGLPTHAGLHVLGTTAATCDATVVTRLKQAGLVFAGKLNMSPMALGASTHNPDFGDCFNPHGVGLSAGGSSGGSACAVAAGLVGIALGTDTMGSVRLPAALCGVVGYKPSWGRLPVDGLVPLCAMLDHIGVLSRYVEDARLAFSIMRADPSAGNQHSVRGGGKTPATEIDNGAKSVRLGVPQNRELLQLQPDVEKTFLSACARLTEQGVSLEPVDIADVNLSQVRRAGLLLCEAELLTTLEGIYPNHPEQLPAELVKLLDYVFDQSAKSLGQAVARLAEARYKFEAWMDGLDAFVLPTCAHTAFPMSASVPVDVADLTVIANVMGAPAISLPLPEPAGDLPVGLQLIGRYGRDEQLLALSGDVESRLVSST